MSALKEDLAVVTKTLKQLSRKTESLAKKVDKLEKAKAAKKPKAKKAAKAKAKRRVVAKKRVAPKKRAVAKRRVAPKKRVAPKRKVTARRAPKKSASEVILSIMKASRSALSSRRTAVSRSGSVFPSPCSAPESRRCRPCR